MAGGAWYLDCVSDALASATCSAAVVGKGNSSPYEMFEVCELSTQGAFFAGSILLEPGESLTLVLKFDDGTRVEVKALVESAQQNGSPGMRVVFKDGHKISARLR